MAGQVSSVWEVLSDEVTLEGDRVKTTTMFVGTGSLVRVVSFYQDEYAVENIVFVPGAEVSYIEEEDENGILVVVGKELAPIGEEYEDS